MPTVQIWKLRARWLFSMHYLWAFLGLFAATLAVLALAHAKQEACLRWWGMLLQFFGIVMVIRDLVGAQTALGERGLRQRVQAKLAQWPGRNVTVSLSGAAAMGITGFAARLTVRAPTNPLAPVADRLHALEENFRHIDKELGQAHAAVDQERRDRTDSVKTEAAAREQADQDLLAKVREVSTGSFTFSLFGVSWLAAGLVLSSTSVEVAKWIGRLAKWTGWTW